MSIHFISGKPGGGKSLYATKLIIDEFIHGDRQIVTNVPLLIPRFYEYVSEKFPVAVERRLSGGRHISEILTLFDQEEMSHFFTIRGGGVRLENIGNVQWKSGARPDYSKVKDKGIFYVVDEVHIGFNARAWADTGAQVIYYLSQHRKLGDDVICITQNVGNVDKQFRSVAQDYTYIKNLAKQRAGLFRLPYYFCTSTYSQPATATSKAEVSGYFTLDVTGIASCYDTAKGVGIIGRAGADTGARKKGIHWLWFAVGAPIALFCLVHYLPLLFVHVVTPSKGVVPPVIHVGSVFTNSPTMSPHGAVDVPVDGTPAVRPSTQVVCVGYVGLEGKWKVFLSDGRIARSSRYEVQSVAEDFVKVFGQEYECRHAPEKSGYLNVPIGNPVDYAALASSSYRRQGS